MVHYGKRLFRQNIKIFEPVFDGQLLVALPHQDSYIFFCIDINSTLLTI